MKTPAEYSQIKAYYFNLLPTLSEEKWLEVEAVATVRVVKKGDYFLRPGQVCNHVSFINYGLVRGYYLLDGREYVTGFFGGRECQYFSAYESFLTRKPTELYYEALEDTQVVDITYDDLQELYRKVPGADRLGRFVAENLYIILTEKNASYLLDSPEQRYLKLLEARPELFQQVPQYMIASYLGVTPEALSRIRSRLSKKAERELIDLDQ